MIALLLMLAPLQTQAEMTTRAGADARRADAAVDAAYRAATAEMRRRDARHLPDAGPGPTDEASLDASQRAWTAFRDAQCVVEGNRYRGGTARPMIEAQCRARLSRDRVAQLDALTRPLQ